MKKRYGYITALLIAPMLLMPGNATLRASDEVTFQFRVPGAKKVRLFGSFNSWSRGYQLKHKGADKWEQTIELVRGRHEYKFLVDGKWRYDAAMPSIDDGLYSRNNVIVVR